MGSLIVFISLLALGFFVGRMQERNHYKQLETDEAALSHIMDCNIKTVPDSFQAGGALVSGNVVIAVDYFKFFVASWKMIFGGRLRSYESLVERARREALVRLKKQADAMGADAVYNVRFEFSTIGQQPKASGVELLAYGTAVKRFAGFKA
ncbi:YbjQ family protein [Fretibacter rubidus]|uniref:YbjQ family protein n=1 Tax=Fretibacter rubidus TaxID=570162 RepID=UPI00352B3F5A